MGMTMEANEVRKAYKRQYRLKNRERINAQQREWRASHPEQVKQYNERYWEKVAENTKNLRKSWDDYGISVERRDELQGAVRSDQYADMVRSAALAADEKAAEHILLSVTENVTYERLEYHEKLGRCPLGRTNFYGARRLFFHYLDEALKNAQRESNKKG